MAVSGISPASANNYQTTPLADFRQTFMQMVKAIKSGDLSGAQQAYATLDQMQSNGQAPAADPNSPFAQALSQIGQSLQGGNIAGAQQTLASLDQQMHAHHQHHRPSNDASTSSPAPAVTGASGDDTAALSPTVGNSVNLTV
jgi:hypothetical protein